MKIKYNILVTVIIGALLLASFYFISYNISKYTGLSISDNINPALDKERIFETCLEEKDITLYINSEDSDATLKENSLIKYLKNVKIFNCKNNNLFCAEKGIDGPFPTWIIENNQIKRDISIEELAKFSGCKI